MNAENIATGTVHSATTVKGHIVQSCGIKANQRASLVETDKAITCRRCSKVTPAPAPITKAPASKKSTGPVTWGVFTATGELATFRTTKREALVAAERIGGTVGKI